MHELIIKTSESGKSKYFGFMLDGDFVKCASKKTALILISKFNSLNGEINDLSGDLSKQSKQSSGSTPAETDSTTAGEGGSKLRPRHKRRQFDKEIKAVFAPLRRAEAAGARAEAAGARAEAAGARAEAAGARAEAAGARAEAITDQGLQEAFSILSQLERISEFKLRGIHGVDEILGSPNQLRDFRLDPETINTTAQEI